MKSICGSTSIRILLCGALLSLGMICFSSGSYPVFATTCKCTNGGSVACSSCTANGTPPGGCSCTFSQGHATEDPCDGAPGACNRHTETCTAMETVKSCTAYAEDGKCKCHATYVDPQQQENKSALQCDA